VTTFAHFFLCVFGDTGVWRSVFAKHH